MYTFNKNQLIGRNCCLKLSQIYVKKVCFLHFISVLFVLFLMLFKIYSRMACNNKFCVWIKSSKDKSQYIFTSNENVYAKHIGHLIVYGNDFIRLQILFRVCFLLVITNYYSYLFLVQLLPILKINFNNSNKNIEQKSGMRCLYAPLSKLWEKEKKTCRNQTAKSQLQKWISAELKNRK